MVQRSTEFITNLRRTLVIACWVRSGRETGPLGRLILLVQQVGCFVVGWARGLPGQSRVARELWGPGSTRTACVFVTVRVIVVE